MEKLIFDIRYNFCTFKHVIFDSLHNPLRNLL